MPTTAKAIPKWRKRHNVKYDVKWRGVVKVQRSLFPSGAEQTILIYSRDESVHFQGPIDAAITGWFGKSGDQDQHKFFAFAELRGTIVHLIRKVDWRDW